MRESVIPAQAGMTNLIGLVADSKSGQNFATLHATITHVLESPKILRSRFASLR
jgi:hypothetical protein